MQPCGFYTEWSLSYLVLAPEQVVGLVVNTGAHVVHAVVMDAEVEIPKPEDQPVEGEGTIQLLRALAASYWSTPAF